MSEQQTTITQEQLLRWAGVAAAALGLEVSTHMDHEVTGRPAVNISEASVCMAEDGQSWEVNEWNVYDNLHEALCEAVAAVAFTLAKNALALAGWPEGEG